MCVIEFSFPFINQNILCCGHSKKTSHRDGYCEYLKHAFKLMGKKIITIFYSNFFSGLGCSGVLGTVMGGLENYYNFIQKFFRDWVVVGFGGLRWGDYTQQHDVSPQK